ncbi:MAG: DotU family type IV/VI secretion system protein [Opitutaceae bacterium]|jgi:type VI protein secretion system component VasF|nr:DotU family type IV/VI secretion system protein [Opitutaceae bacterium]
MSASLITHCDSLFQAICRYNRIARKGSGASLDYTQVRTEVEEMFEVLARTARGDIALGEQYRRVELPLIIFVDSMMAGSALPFAQKWSNNPMAFARNERSGDDKFFALLEETLAEKKEGTDERLAIFYICMGLGFTGGNQPEFLRKKMDECAQRVRAYVDIDESAFITPASYQHTNTANLPLPMAASLVPLLIVLSGLLLVVVAVNVYTFYSASAELTEALNTITAHNPATTTAQP